LDEEDADNDAGATWEGSDEPFSLKFCVLEASGQRVALLKLPPYLAAAALGVLTTMSSPEGASNQQAGNWELPMPPVGFTAVPISACSLARGLAPRASTCGAVAEALAARSDCSKGDVIVAVVHAAPRALRTAAAAVVGRERPVALLGCSVRWPSKRPGRGHDFVGTLQHLIAGTETASSHLVGVDTENGSDAALDAKIVACDRLESVDIEPFNTSEPEGGGLLSGIEVFAPLLAHFGKCASCLEIKQPSAFAEFCYRYTLAVAEDQD
jgi:hypothetical protein